MPRVFPARRRLRRGGFEFKDRLCGETPSQQKQHRIPFSWMPSFTVFLRVRITGVVRRAWTGRELPVKLMIWEGGLSPLSDGQSGASCLGRSLGCPHTDRVGAVTVLACSLGQLREGTSWVMLVAQPPPPVLPIHISSCPPSLPWEKNGVCPLLHKPRREW